MPPAAARTARGAPAFDRRWLGPRHWPSWGIAGLAWLLQCLPQRARDALARLVLPLVWRLTGRQQHNARINLGLCFPQQPPEWREQVLRCASKSGRPVREVESIAPAADFPSFDGRPPLKTLVLHL